MLSAPTDNIQPKVSTVRFRSDDQTSYDWAAGQSLVGRMATLIDERMQYRCAGMAGDPALRDDYAVGLFCCMVSCATRLFLR